MFRVAVLEHSVFCQLSAEKGVENALLGFPGINQKVFKRTKCTGSVQFGEKCTGSVFFSEV